MFLFFSFFFLFSNHKIQAEGSMLVLETCMDIVFMVDILINFRTGYFVQETGEVEFDQKKVAMKYIQSWFFLDLVSGIPFALFDNVSALDSLSVIKILKVGRVAKAARLLSFLKLTKIAKTTKVLSKDNEEILERCFFLSLLTF
jgi:ABC-type branched-subunit amino acid transport system ATPase component